MSWFFDDPAARQRLRSELEQWRGAIFRAHECKKGVATDCVQFVHAVLVDSGAISPVTWPAYVTVRGGLDMRLLLIEQLNKVPELAPLQRDMDELIDGDVCVYSAGKVGHHVGIVCEPPTIWHCLHHQGVCQGNVHDGAGRSLAIAVYRARG